MLLNRHHFFSFLRTFLHAMAACACAVALAAPASAQLNQFTGTNGTDYNDPANWILGNVPVGGETAVIGEAVMGAQNPATTDLSADAPMPLFEFKVGKGPNGDGTVNHSAGALIADNWAVVGDGEGGGTAFGSYNLSGTGTVQVGATNPFNSALAVGTGAGGQGTFDMNSADNSVLAEGYSIGDGDTSTGVFTQSAGTVTANVWINVGQGGAASGTYNMSGGSLTTPELSVAESAPSIGTFNASESSSLSLGSVRISRNEGSTGGTLNLIGSDVTFNAGQFSVASNDGAFNVDSAGAVNFFSDGGGLSTINVAGDVTLNDGLGAGSTASLGIDLTGGDLGGDLLLIDLDGVLTGQFTGLPEGTVVPGANGRFITYDYLGVGDVALVIPEPSCVVMVLVGLVGLGFIRRR